MLNKGPYVREAVRTLDDILRRMQAHQIKKRAMLRPLHLAHDLIAELSNSEELESHAGYDPPGGRPQNTSRPAAAAGAQETIPAP
jgi:hypothetical protein